MSNNLLTNGALCDHISDDLKLVLNSTVKTFDEALKQFNLNEIFLAFNGGKDCTVLLHLLTEYLKRNQKDPRHLRVFYMKPRQPFQEIEDFVESCRTQYNIDIGISEGPIKQVLQKIKNENSHLKAVFMGNRRTDPYCEHLSIFKKTDNGWPEFMRINPILDWTCENIWEYILKNNVPYCSLYDKGYTSIGDQTNTIPNPHLRANGSHSYLPAFKLENADKLERAGRT